MFGWETAIFSNSRNKPPFPIRHHAIKSDGVHGPSHVSSRPISRGPMANGPVFPAAIWIIYELHIGAFTDEGTFQAAVERLDELVELGITAIELMPVSDAAGRWNWGYDGVCLFAPNRNYGTPSGLRLLVDEAHRRGLAVILDVVYNHLGPEGNYLGQSGPYLSSKHTTVWGAAPNFDDQEHGRDLRRFFIANAVHWFDEYHIDGLRVDAIHCMKDESETHVVEEMSRAVKDWSLQSGRQALLIAESNVYDPNMLQSLDDGGIGFDGEWCDDFLHSLFAVVRPGEQLCHRSYESGSDLDQTLRFGYVYEGTLRQERGRQSPTQRVDTSGLIYSIQHHDFIGNHPLGKRLHQLTSPDTQRAAAALLILSPAIPMLFMGEEFSCEQPFQFFVDFEDDGLRQAVVQGRMREYPQHDWSGGVLPIDARAFSDSKIGAAGAGDLAMREWYTKLIQLRKQGKKDGWLSQANVTVQNDPSKGFFSLRYHLGELTITVAVRLTADESDDGPYEISGIAGDLILDSRCSASERTHFLANHAKIFRS